MRFLEPMRRALRQIANTARAVQRLESHAARIREAVGRLEERQVASLSSARDAALDQQEWRVFSQWGEDGILQHLLRHVNIPRKIFVEFGVETYVEANTRWLLTAHGWSGLIMDGSEENIQTIRRDPIYWQHNLKALQTFITRENIDSLIRGQGIEGEIGLLSVDIDGVDYWVWEAIQCISPALVVAEYNALFGPVRRVTVPYDAAFTRAKAHHSCVYYGASLAALAALGRRKGLALVGCNSAGNNAFFVRRDLLPPGLPELTPGEAFRPRLFREARNADGSLAFQNTDVEAAMIADLPLVEVAE